MRNDVYILLEGFACEEDTKKQYEEVIPSRTTYKYA